VGVDILHVHSSVLAAASPFFRAMFRSQASSAFKFLSWPHKDKGYNKRLTAPAFGSSNLLEIKKGTGYLYPTKTITAGKMFISTIEKGRERAF
jgi:hypothetical protein